MHAEQQRMLPTVAVPPEQAPDITSNLDQGCAASSKLYGLSNPRCWFKQALRVSIIILRIAFVFFIDKLVTATIDIQDKNYQRAKGHWRKSHNRLAEHVATGSIRWTARARLASGGPPFLTPSLIGDRCCANCHENIIGLQNGPITPDLTSPSRSSLAIKARPKMYKHRHLTSLCRRRMRWKEPWETLHT
ncbi:hypothetical protein NPX13_g11261 [Xylaria arbuscula]|uniref:Uncharacterized protein n=1 Tax=Xylaria arbuscula TaxID=114810 RepID=A0A9W8N309_9PEZI|nr:hypothetical protein NPX13_g11261 [Xylaria arbuscula]